MLKEKIKGFFGRKNLYFSEQLKLLNNVEEKKVVPLLKHMILKEKLYKL